MFSSEDLALLQDKGISQETVLYQLGRFKTGFPFLKLYSSASTDKGILSLNDESLDHFRQVWSDYLQSDNIITKFVPASGAASRMFKSLFSFVDNSNEGMSKDVAQFFEQVKNFAFFDKLNDACKAIYSLDIESLASEGRQADVLKALLNLEGLNYGTLPKGLLLFHSYEDGPRTPIEEHFVEGALYAKSKQGIVNLHFTLSPEHLPLVEKLVEGCIEKYENKFGVKFNVSYSVQKSSTDTLAADLEGNPFRENGKLLFRPGGHGALIENLNDIDSDIIFVKNIDNVVPDSLKPATVTYKEALAGVLVSFQKEIHSYLREIRSTDVSIERLKEILSFLENKVCVINPAAATLNQEELKEYLISKLNRPVRVCGVVKNTGEPGGGPFLAYSQDGTIAGQILESSQIDMTDEKAKAIFTQSSHFNPVDLVCAVRDIDGNKFDLPNYVDHNTGFIAEKSKGGAVLQALELPGLWNGAMSDWNTIFVEVPIETFNPVKTVNDLLRTEHQ